jgi:hypothetical protein
MVAVDSALFFACGFLFSRVEYMGFSLECAPILDPDPFLHRFLRYLFQLSFSQTIRKRNGIHENPKLSV